MKPAHLLLLLSAFGFSGCGKIKSLVGGSPAKAENLSTGYSGPLVTELDDASYASFPLKSGRVVVIDYYADWCGPCRQLGPILDSVALENKGKVLVGRVNVDKCPKAKSAEGVSGIPDVRIYRDGELVDKFLGCPEESEVRRRINSHTEGLAAPPAAKAASGNEAAVKPMSKDWLPPGMKRR